MDRKARWDAIVSAVAKVKQEVSEQSLQALLKAYSSVSSIGPEYMYPPDVFAAIKQGLALDKKDDDRGT